MAILDHVEHISVCLVLHRRRIAEVDERELPGNRHFTCAITVVLAGNIAPIITVVFLRLSGFQLRRWFDRIDLVNSPRQES